VNKPPIQHVHAESVRIGIRLTGGHFTGHRLPEDKVASILKTLPPGYRAEEFPLEVLTSAYRERSRLRREAAQRCLEALIHHAGDSTLLSESDLEGLVSKAWRMARAMDDMDLSEGVLDQLDTETRAGD
jgi:hypothetical protein